jgi:hypothetical protein
VNPLLCDVVAVARGEVPPAHSAAAYRDAAARWAETAANPDESPTVALARLCASGSPVVAALYRAAAIATALETLDITDLVPTDERHAALRRAAWAGLLDLAEPHRRADETLRATVRRLLGENLAARAIFLTILNPS